MPDRPLDQEDRLTQFERALDPSVAKFAPKQATSSTAPMALQIAQVREYANILLKTCDEMDKIITASETDARKAADILISMAARIK